MIEAEGLTKRYGDTLAVDNLSFSVAPGKITGFLGPNGAGKTTTMRLILGLDRPTAGRVTVNGKPFDRTVQPMRQVGALLDAKAVHGGRSAYNHLLCLAESNNLPRRRVDEVLGLVESGDDHRAAAVLAHRAAHGCDELREQVGLRGAHPDRPLGVGGDEFVDGAVSDEPATADDQQVVGRVFHL